MKPHIIVIMIALFVVGVTIGHVSALPNLDFTVRKCPSHLALAKSLADINAWNASLTTVSESDAIILEFDRILNALARRFPDMTKDGIANSCYASVNYLNQIGKHISLLEFMEYIDIQIDPEVKWSGFLDLIAVASMTFVLDFEEKGADFLMKRALDKTCPACPK